MYFSLDLRLIRQVFEYAFLSQVNEIAFINTLEAQNRKIEVQEKHQVPI